MPAKPPLVPPPAARAAPPRVVVTEELVQRHHRGVWRYLRFLGAQPGAADDLTQEAFLALVKQPPEDRGEAALAAWLRTTARHAFLASGQRARRGVVLAEPELLEQVYCEHATDDQGAGWLDALRACTATLGARERDALALRYARRAGWAAIGAALGIEEQGAKTLLRRIRARLRACIERRLHDDA